MMDTRIALRRATDSDADFSFQLRKAAMGPYITQVWGWEEADQRRVHTRDFAPKRLRIIIADGVDVGVVDVEEQPSGLYIQSLDLLPEVQGRGIGTWVINEVLHQAAIHDQVVMLSVLAVNPRARQLYERLGFVEALGTAHHQRYG